MPLVTITWSDGETFTADLTIDAIKFYQDLGTVSVIFIPDEQPTTEPTVTEPTPTVTEPIQMTTQEPTTETTQQPVSAELISISPGVFQIINDRVAGEVLYIASTTFEGTRAKAFMRIRTTDNQDLLLKENDLSFSETERDETIFFNESAFGETELIVTLFVWDLDNNALSSTKTFPVTKLVPIVQPPFLPPTIPGVSRPGVAGTAFGVAAIGLLSLGVLGALGLGKKK